MNQYGTPQTPYPTTHTPPGGTPYPTQHAYPAAHTPPAGVPYPMNYAPQPGTPYAARHPLTGLPSAPYPTAGPYGAAPHTPPRRRGRTLLPVLGGGFVGAFILAAVVGLQTPERFPAPVPAGPSAGTVAADPTGQVGFRESGTLSALDLQPGDCYNTGQLPPAPGTSTPISTVEAVPCADPHTDQVIAKVAYAPTDTLADVRATKAGADCERELRQKVTAATLTDPAYSLGTLVPADETTWSAGRTIACIVMSSGEKTGSVLGQ